jgi:DNA-binding CsgD family transcriptional regulator
MTPPLKRSAKNNPTNLTRRQRQIADMVAKGMGTNEIAAATGLTPGTIGVHISNILVIVGVANRLQLAIAMRDRPEELPTRRSDRQLRHDRYAHEYTRTGLAIDEIAAKYKVGRTAVLTGLKKRGIGLLRRRKIEVQFGRAPARQTRGDIYAAEYTEQGLTIEAIAARWGVNPRSVLDRLTHRGLYTAQRAEIDRKFGRAA